MAAAQKTINFLDKLIEADSKTDVVHMMCPMHLLNIQKGLMDIAVGQVLSILTDYDGALEDIPDWCAYYGHELLGLYEHDDYYEFFIKKCREIP
jgi:TusA-related sulfurtransferase